MCQHEPGWRVRAGIEHVGTACDQLSVNGLVCLAGGEGDPQLTLQQLPERLTRA